jgi:hypothetical protein
MWSVAGRVPIWPTSTRAWCSTRPSVATPNARTRPIRPALVSRATAPNSCRPVASAAIASSEPASSSSARRQGRLPKAGPVARISSAAPRPALKGIPRPSLRDGLDRQRLDQRARQRAVARHAAPVAELDRYRADQDRFARDRGRIEPAIENVDVAQLRDRGRIDAEVNQHLARQGGGRPRQPRGHGRHGPVGEGRDRLNRAHAAFGVRLDVDRRPAGGKVKARQGCGIEDLISHPLAVDRKGHAVRPGDRQGVGQGPIVLKRLRRAEIEVEGDSSGAGFDQALQNRGMVTARPRPGPAPERLQARRVDHDQHELARSRT